VRDFMVCFHSFRDIQEFVNLCTRQPFRVTVGSERYQVNATSLMGMFSLNCRRPQRVMMECTEEEFDRFRQEAQRFLSEE